MASVTIDRGPVSGAEYAENVPRSDWTRLVSARQQFCMVHLPADCRYLLRYIDEAERLGMWQALGCESLEAFIRDRLELDPAMVEWAMAGLKAMRPDWAVPFEAAVAVGKALGSHGGDRRSEKVTDQGVRAHLARGTGQRAYTLARLRRDDPDLALRVEAGEISANAAAVSKGWRKSPGAYRQLCTAWHRATFDERERFRNFMTAD